MSYLLDALRQSQADRAQHIPGVNSTPASVVLETNESQPKWLWAVLVVVLLNSALLLFLLLRPANPPAVQALPVVIPEEKTENKSEVTPAEPQTISLQQRVKITELDPASSVTAVEPESTTPSPAMTQDNALNTNRAPLVQSTILTNQDHASHARDDSAENVNNHSAPIRLTAQQLPEHLRQHLPAMEITSHIYSTQASDSFVMINGIALNAGMELSPGLRLISVTPEGVVLRVQDTEFLLNTGTRFVP